ncbi:MAG: diacylglycerol/lipid kinase family protein, partial [Halioglobus sp.]
MNIAFIIRGGLADSLEEIVQVASADPRLGSVDILECEYAGHGIELARAAASVADYVVAVGGDGTLNEVVNGCLQFAETSPGGRAPPVGIVAMGTANDFTRSAGIEGTLEEVCELAVAQTVRDIDVGRLSYLDSAGQQRHRYFVNVADIGVGARVARITNRRKRTRKLGATFTYVSAIVQGFLLYRKPLLTVSTREGFNWEGRCLACVIGNGRAFGAGLYATPGARIDDGVFNCTVIGDVGLLDFFHYLPSLRHGEKIDHDQLRYVETESISVSSVGGRCLIDVDGESLVGADVKAEMLPARLVCDWSMNDAG